VYKPLGRDLADALATFRSFEIAQEAKRGKLNAHGRDSDLTITRHRRDGDGILAAFEAYGVWIETRIGELENSIAQVTSVVKRLAHTQPNLKAQVESGDIGKRGASREIRQIKKQYSLNDAAKLVGVNRTALFNWFRQVGIVIPHVRNGSKVMLRERDIERILEKQREVRSSNVSRL